MHAHHFEESVLYGEPLTSVPTARMRFLPVTVMVFGVLIKTSSGVNRSWEYNKSDIQVYTENIFVMQPTASIYRFGLFSFEQYYMQM